MENIAKAQDLRALLSLAAKLRGLAAQTDAQADRSLFLEAAAALETRAQWLAQALPGDCQPLETVAHRPVDMVV